MEFAAPALEVRRFGLPRFSDQTFGVFKRDRINRPCRRTEDRGAKGTRQKNIQTLNSSLHRLFNAMKKLIPFLFLFFAASTFGQKTVSQLQPKHAAALAQFLANSNYLFLSENVIEDEDLNFMHSFLGTKAMPYYYVGDFNKDKISDFAVILQRKTESSEHAESEDHALAVAIFNGSKNGTFRMAFKEVIEATLRRFLNFRDKHLYFSVSESDADTRIFTSAGKGYIVEYETDYP